MNEQHVSYEMTTEEKDLLKQDIDALKLKVSAFAINLSPEDRKRLVKMGNKSIAFVSQAFKYATEYPEYVPPYLNMEDFAKDLDFANDLRDLLKVAEPILEQLNDTNMMAGVQAFTAARMFYDAVKSAAKSNAPGADTLVAELKKRYLRKKSVPEEIKTKKAAA